MRMIGYDGYDRYDGFGHLPHRLEQGTPKKSRYVLSKTKVDLVD